MEDGSEQAAGQGKVRDLVERAKRGNQEAFDDLQLHFQARLGSWCRYHMSPSLERWYSVDDVVQDTFLKAYKTIGNGGFRWRDNLKSPLRDEVCFFYWLAKIAEHVIVDVSRRFPEEKNGMQMEHLAAEAPTAERIHLREARFLRLKKAVASLNPARRKVVMLLKIYGLSRKEVAKALGRSEGAISVVLFRALKQLKKVLKDISSFSLPRWDLEEGVDREGGSDLNGEKKVSGPGSPF